MIKVDHISLTLDGTPILNDVGLSAHPGEITAVLGPNGAGKSSLLRCIAGVLKADAGDIRLWGKPLQNYSLIEMAKKRAALSQVNPIDFPFTAYEIAMMGRDPHSVRDAVAQDQIVVDEVLKRLDVLSFKNRIFQSLSGGEQQRVHLARVLAQIWDVDRPCLLLDEPTTALDLKHQHQVLQLIKTLAQERQWTVVLVIHHLTLAKQYADHVCLMKSGKVYDDGSVAAMLSVAKVAKIFEIPQDLARV